MTTRTHRTPPAAASAHAGRRSPCAPTTPVVWCHHCRISRLRGAAFAPSYTHPRSGRPACGSSPRPPHRKCRKGQVGECRFCSPAGAAASAAGAAARPTKLLRDVTHSMRAVGRHVPRPGRPCPPSGAPAPAGRKDAAHARSGRAGGLRLRRNGRNALRTKGIGRFSIRLRPTRPPSAIATVIQPKPAVLRTA